MKKAALDNTSVSVRVQLALMWTVIMFFYAYNDVFMILASNVHGASHASTAPSGTTMLAYALVITPAALMPLLCVVVSPAIMRWVNIVLGLAYFTIIVSTLVPAGTATFYRFIGVAENLVTLLAVWTAWRWPSTASRETA